MCTHKLCLSNIVKDIKNFHLKTNIFAAVKYCCILHGRVLRNVGVEGSPHVLSHFKLKPKSLH